MIETSERLVSIPHTLSDTTRLSTSFIVGVAPDPVERARRFRLVFATFEHLPHTPTSHEAEGAGEIVKATRMRFGCFL